MADKKQFTMKAIDFSELGDDFSAVLVMVLDLASKGTKKQQEAFVDLMNHVMAESDARKCIPSPSKVPEAVSDVMYSLRNEAANLGIEAETSPVVVAYVAAKRLLECENRLEKLTEILVKNGEDEDDT